MSLMSKSMILQFQALFMMMLTMDYLMYIHYLIEMYSLILDILFDVEEIYISKCKLIKRLFLVLQ